MSSTETFRVTRQSGQSDQQVILEAVKGAAPGDTFTYAELASAMAVGSDREYTTRDVQRCVNLANFRYLREHRRRLRNVRGVGYRVALAREHGELAGHHQRRSNRQLKKAMDTLENVRLEEMTPQEQAVHLAQQAINAELYAQQRRLTRQQQAQAKAIASLTGRLDRAGVP